MARRKNPAPVEVEEEELFEDVEEDEVDDLDDVEDEDDGLEEVEEEEEEKPKPKKGAKGKATPKAPAEKKESSGFDTVWLSGHVKETTGQDLDARALRMLLRKMAKDGDIERNVGEDRSRYTFPKGPGDATVKAVIKNVKIGAMTVKKAAAEKKAEPAPAPTPKKSTKAKAAATPAAKAKTPAKATRRKE